MSLFGSNSMVSGIFKERARKKAEEEALIRHNRPGPPSGARGVISDPTQVSGVHKLLKAKGAGHLSEKDVQLVQDTLEEYIAEKLPSSDIQIRGFGTIRLTYQESRKHNLDPFLILAAGYAKRFIFSSKILKNCHLRKVVSIYEEDE